MQDNLVFSVVVPCFNEAEVLGEFHQRLSAIMARLDRWEVIYVNDGSTDDTLARQIALHHEDAHVVVVNLSRNFGKEVATTAGLDQVRGEAVIVIDADLQDPPELIPELVEGWRQGFDTVYAQRRTRTGESWLKIFTARMFYRVMQTFTGVTLPPNTGDFRLMSRRVVTALQELPEHHRFMKGLFAWVGYPSKAVLYDRAPRFAGKTSWSYWKLWSLALEGITSFTTTPLKLATYIGLIISTVAGLYGLWIMGKTIVFGSDLPGYPSLMVVVLFMGGAQLVFLGIIGEYLGRIFNETKRRPLYFVERILRKGEEEP
ncbi:glycosyltransferase family 2 protein [Labrys okinawensis]|uniref:glycosyltransferase family 2 protein n=1 Tax=Labrys okinawensis TaxID=346911 RepID=UPI0039BCB80D